MKMKKITVILSAIFFLSLTYYSCAEPVTDKDLAYVLPKADIFVRKEEPFGHFLGYTTDGGSLLGVAFLTTEVVPEETWGYRDQIVTLVGVNTWGEIAGVKIIEENETPRYTRNLLNDDSWFLDQFKGKDTGDEFILGEDVDAITGATISSSAIARSIEAGLDAVTEKVLYREVEKDAPVRHLILHHILWQINFVFLWIITGIAFVAAYSASLAMVFVQVSMDS